MASGGFARAFTVSNWISSDKQDRVGVTVLETYMATPTAGGGEFINVRGQTLEILMAGTGPDVLFLHGGLWLGEEMAFALELSRHARVIAPMHPGFGASPGSERLASADDLAYFYLDLIDQLNLEHVILAGASFGGWVAAEMAVKNCNAIAGLVLIDALGIRPGKRDERDIADIFGIRDSELLKFAYHDPSRGTGDLRALDDEELRRRLRARDALAHYGWQPYMHNPKLLDRLHRINAPALVIWGEHDGIVKPDYGKAYAAAIPGARFEIIASAAHLAHVERPQDVCRLIADFATGVHAHAHNRQPSISPAI